MTLTDHLPLPRVFISVPTSPAIPEDSGMLMTSTVSPAAVRRREA
eukprot:CAMPEP_0175577802 /NCGR_PEP_ID=MMETSP0096-20121207/45767_1 /TAXON_ID=311494 /ORGANISM="Alexandrium monilatum, Strain CCMP3105" /LENGTH=44 /DNA_ID= /DNA_START= /DNA_END= /DNA_ORIENTATION=